jgi:hypothetical protein
LGIAENPASIAYPRIFRDRTVWFGRVSWRPAVAIANHTKVDTIGYSGVLVEQHVPTGE